MKFDTIKENAKRIFAGSMNQWDRHLGLGQLGKGNSPSFNALLPFVLASQAEREEMREFAQAFEAKPGDWLANAAKADDNRRLDVAWNQVVLRARQAGLELINKWDVRRVGKLIELFPECAPARLRNRPLTCFIADNESCDWMVEATS